MAGWPTLSFPYVGICLCYFIRAQYAFFVLFGWFVRWEVSGCTAASRIYSKQHLVSLCSSPLYLFYLSNHQGNISKMLLGDTFVCRFLQRIWFHTQRKDGANTSSIWSTQTNCYYYNDAPQKYNVNGLLSS